MPRRRVNLHRIGLNGFQQGDRLLWCQTVVAFLDQPMGAGRHAAAAAIATLLIDPSTGRNRCSRANPCAGTRTVLRTAVGIEPGLAEVSIHAVAEADHQPGTVPRLSLSPVQASPRCEDDRWIGSHINAMDADGSKNSSQISNRRQILIACPTDELDPAPLNESLVRRQAFRYVVIGSHFKLRAPPISTMMRKRGSRLQRSQSERSSERDST